MRIAGAIARTAIFAAAAYGGYAALTYFRYGRPKKKLPTTSLDRFMPDPEVIEQHRVFVKAPTDVTWDACCAFDVMDSRIAQLLFDTRGYAMCVKPAHPDLPKGLVDQMETLGWSVLDEAPGLEIVFGTAAKPWLPAAGFRTIPPVEFPAFNEPGWVKIVLNISVRSVARDCSVVTTETRVTTTDADARRRFRNYWAFVSPGVKLIRIVSLRAIKANAEATVQKAMHSAAAVA